MSVEELEKKKLEAELSKLLAEEEKVREEIRHLKMPILLNPRVIAALLVALIGLSATSVKLYFTTVEKNQAVMEKKDAVAQGEAVEAYADNLRKENKRLVKKAEATGIAVEALTNVIIQFRGKMTKKQISGLQLLLNDSNFAAPRPVRTSAIEATEILYFDAADLNVAEQVKEHTEKYFKDLNCPFQSPVSVFKKASGKHGKGDILVSIHHECTG